jgi:hypothetical protein
MRIFGKWLLTEIIKLKTGSFFLTVLIMSPLLCCSVAMSFAATIELRQTGQTGCWDESDNTVGCAGTGQDGDKLFGAAWPNPRFVDNDNGTVTDKLTDLIWLKNANCTETVGGIAKGSGYLIWADALTWANSLASGSCGLSDGSTANQWRLPSKNELQSLVNSQPTSIATWLNSQEFTNVLLSYYWSSTTYAPSTTSAWYVNMIDGLVGYGSKANSDYVWPVRTGQ